MGAYLLRRLLLIIPTLLGIMVINFVLTQFVPGGPVEQVLARLDGAGDAFQSISGGGGDAGSGGAPAAGAGNESGYIGARGLTGPTHDEWHAARIFFASARTKAMIGEQHDGGALEGTMAAEVAQ